MSDKPFGKYGCFIDGLEGEAPCVFDKASGFVPSDCSEAVKLQSEGKSQEDCEYWRSVQRKIEIVCPVCGYHFLK